jgi:threonine dehydrogenase-like Zn-dependent dehydrogenase
MKGISLPQPGRIEIVDIPEPALGPDDVLVEVGYVGLCGSDLLAYRGLSAMVTYPRIPGHEVGGVVAAVGAAVPKRVRAGVRVTVSPYSECGACPACRAGRTNTCRLNQTLGVQRDGALTERIAIHHSKVYASDSLSMDELALVEPLSVGSHAVTRGRVRDGDTVLVIGCGAVGLGAIAAAARAGATVMAADIDEAKLALAAKLGAQHTVNSANDDPAARVAAITNSEGVSVAIEAVGMPATWRLALDSVSVAGRVVVIGYAKEPASIDTRLVIGKELDLLGSRNALGEFASVIATLEERTLPFTDLITRVVPFETAAQAFADWSASPQAFTKILVEVKPG